MSKHISPLISEFPAEILQHIYTFLPTIQIIRCREVCAWWKQTVDGMLYNDETWLKLCTRDYSNVYNDARLKCSPDLSWRELYKSLHIWHNMKHAEETWFEFAQRDKDYIITIHAWKGTAAAHTDQTLAYYNLETLQPMTILNLGKYRVYEENKNVIVYMICTHARLAWFRNLKIVPKINGVPSYENVLEIENVNSFMLINQKIYFNKWYRASEQKFFEICVCNISDGFKCSTISRINFGVWLFSYSAQSLNIINPYRRIYTLIDNEFIMTDEVVDADHFYKLCKYNLVERANFSGSIMDARGIISRRRYSEDLTVRLWGNLALVGNQKGELKIYDRDLLFKEKGPLIEDHSGSLVIDIQTKPIKEYELNMFFNLTNSRINGIDLIPIKDGHIVLVSTRFKIMALCIMNKK